MAKKKEISGNWKNWLLVVLIIVAIVVAVSSFNNKDVRYDPEEGDNEESCQGSPPQNAEEECLVRGGTIEEGEGNRVICNVDGVQVIIIGYVNSEGDLVFASAEVDDYYHRVCSANRYISNLNENDCNNPGICQATWLGGDVNWVFDACTGQMDPSNPSSYKVRCKDVRESFCSTNPSTCSSTHGNQYVQTGTTPCSTSELLAG